MGSVFIKNLIFQIACIIITGVLHYVFLVVFFLMLCNGISVARSVIYVFKTKSRLPIYIAVAWGKFNRLVSLLLYM